MKLPAIQFYPGDWHRDPGIRTLSMHDRGVWLELLLLMHESDQRGVLVLNGRPMSDSEIARAIGLDNQTFNQTLTTLLTSGVASREPNTGALMNRRMVRDEELRKVRTECGKKGGNPRLVNQIQTTTVNQIQTPSSSSSSSSSNTPIVPKGDERGVQSKLVLEIPEPELSKDEFANEIFSLYPRKDGKAEALKAIVAAFKLIPPLELRVKVCEYAKAVALWPESEKQFVPWCQKWMNKKRWLDDLAAWVRKSNSKETIEALKLKLAQHPGNRDWVGFNAATAKREDIDAFWKLDREIKQMEKTI